MTANGRNVRRIARNEGQSDCSSDGEHLHLHRRCGVSERHRYVSLSLLARHFSSSGFSGSLAGHKTDGDDARSVPLRCVLLSAESRKKSRRTEGRCRNGSDLNFFPSLSSKGALRINNVGEPCVRAKRHPAIKDRTQAYPRETVKQAELTVPKSWVRITVQ